MNAIQLGHEPVYPHAAGDPLPPFPDNGITKRELFAAMAMQGLCAALTNYDGPSRVIDMDGIAVDAVSFADALLEKLAERQMGEEAA